MGPTGPHYRSWILLVSILLSAWVVACGPEKQEAANGAGSNSGPGTMGADTSIEALIDLVVGNQFTAALAMLDESPTDPTWNYERGFLYRKMAEYYAGLNRFGLNVETAGYAISSSATSVVPQFFLGICRYQLGKYEEAAETLRGLDLQKLPFVFRGVADAFLAAATTESKPVTLDDPAAQLLFHWLATERGLASSAPPEFDMDGSLAAQWAPILRASVDARRGLIDRALRQIRQVDLTDPVYVEVIKIQITGGDTTELPVKYYTAFPWRVLAHIYYAAAEDAFTKVLKEEKAGFLRTKAHYYRGITRSAQGRCDEAAGDLEAFSKETGEDSALLSDPEIGFLLPVAQSVLAGCTSAELRQIRWDRKSSELAYLAAQAEYAKCLANRKEYEETKSVFLAVARALKVQRFEMLDDEGQSYYSWAVDRLGDVLYSYPASLLALPLEPLIQSVYVQSSNFSPSRNNLAALLRMAHTYFVRGKVTGGQEVLRGMDANDPQRRPDGRSRFYPILMLYQQTNSYIAVNRGGNQVTLAP